MGNKTYRASKPTPPISHPTSIEHQYGPSDFRSKSNAFTTTNAPWNITQWIDPFDPHPKVVTMPMILVVRK